VILQNLQDLLLPLCALFAHPVSSDFES
jgi:hypothetical protein